MQKIVRMLLRRAGGLFLGGLILLTGCDGPRAPALELDFIPVEGESPLPFSDRGAGRVPCCTSLARSEPTVPVSS